MQLSFTKKNAALSVALAAAMGVSASASADILNFTYSGLFTMLTSTGAPVQNTSLPFYYDATWGYGLRSQVTGTMSFNTATGAGTGTLTPFAFLGPTAAASGLTFQAIGDGAGNPGPLVLGNMGFNYGATVGIPVSIVMDASGLFAKVGGGLPPIGTAFDCTGLPCATPASNGISKNKIPIGPALIATTTWNTTTIAGAGMGSNPSGGLPLIADTIGGSPMVAGAFEGFNANFDITSMTPIPIPAAAWLMGSALVGLAGLARRRKTVPEASTA